MNSLDKDMMHYFYDEMEKQAIILKTLKGVGKVVAGAAKGAARGVGNYTRNMSRLSTIGNQSRTKVVDGVETVVKNKDAKSIRHLLGGAFLTGASLYAGKKGYDKFKASRIEQKTTLPKPMQSGIINLNQY